MDGWVDGWMGGWIGGWVDGRIGGWVEGWVDGRMGGEPTHTCICFHFHVLACYRPSSETNCLLSRLPCRKSQSLIIRLGDRSNLAREYLRSDCFSLLALFISGSKPIFSFFISAMAPAANASDSTPVPTVEPVTGSSDDYPNGGVILDEYPTPCNTIAQHVTEVQEGVIALRLAAPQALPKQPPPLLLEQPTLTEQHAFLDLVLPYYHIAVLI